MDKKEKRKKRKQIRLMKKESTWLQKAAFALKKAEAVHEKIEGLDLPDRPDPLSVDIGGSTVPVEDLEEALEDRVDTVRASVEKERGRMM